MGFKIGKVSTRPHISDHVLEMRYNGEKLVPGTEIPKTSVIDLIVGDGSLNRVVNDNDDSPEASDETEGDGGE